METKTILSDLYLEVQIMRNEATSEPIRITLDRVLWHLYAAQNTYRAEIEMAKLTGRSEVLAELLKESKKPEPEPWTETQQYLRTLLKTKILCPDHVDVRIHNCLNAAKVYTIGDLVSLEKKEIARFRNLGTRSLAALEDWIDGLGITFGMSVEKYRLHED